MTTIDLIFLWFYMLTGVTIIATAAGLATSAAIYSIIMLGLKVTIPLSVVGLISFLWHRIRKNPFKISINK